MDHEQEISRLFALEYGEPAEVLFRFAAISVGGMILVLYTGWQISFVWLGVYFGMHLVNLRFLRSRGPEYTAMDTIIAGVLFLAILASFLWLPFILMLQRDLALQISGAAALGSVFVFLVRRSDTMKFMVYGQIAIVGSAVMIALVTTLPRIDFFLAQLAMSFCSLGMVGYLAHAILASRRERLEGEETERRLRHAQKLEALGQLTGGVAHDFNNLLAVIQGNAELLGDQLGKDTPTLAAIIRATERGSDLTQRLLGFSRRQPLKPEIVDLTRIAPDTIALLRRTLCETIRLEIRLADDLWPVLVDRGQLENALVNLSLNSRDAMTEGGELSIGVRNMPLTQPRALIDGVIPPGDWVVVSVTDTGAGMPEMTRKRAFEPFFTTKPPGAGSGLGLSLVHGFAHQSGGAVDIKSTPGRGTTVELYLPRANPRETAPAPAPQRDIPRGRGERVLVVEDEPEVRRLLKRCLIDLGYTVHIAANAAEARTRASGLDGIDLLLSDIVLPGGMNGFDNARELKALYPDMRVVFISGYSADHQPDSFAHEQGFPLLQKPFHLAELGRVIAEALQT